MNKLQACNIFLCLIILGSCQSKPVINRSDALWNIVSQKCIPKQLQNLKPEPCDEVNISKGSENGYVVLKDLNGPLQYLLMPTAKIAGVESPEVLKSNTPNYFYESWLARSYMIKKYGSTIEDEEISLAINSQLGRSQNQLHVHISCIKPDVKKIIHDNSAKITSKWSRLPVKILGHHYKVIKISEAELRSKNIFELVAQDIPDGEQNLSKYGIGLMALKNKKKSYDYVVLASRAELPFNRGSVEEIQDHLCPQLSAELLQKAGQGRK
jgi:CDP-diacylglycerol pyrophosphatase